METVRVKAKNLRKRQFTKPEEHEINFHNKMEGCEETPILPLDVLVMIFQYFNDFDDLKNVTLVCKQWLQATQIAKISKIYKICFSFVTISDGGSEPLKLFNESDRLFSNVYFENAKFAQINENFWSRWSDTMSELTFDYKYATPDLPGGNFVELLKFTPNLRTLNLVCCLHWFNQYILELSANDRALVYASISGLKELHFYFSEKCLDTLRFDSWIDEAKNLKNIDFDLKSTKRQISAETYDIIFNFLTKYATVVKGLHICDNSRSVDKKIVQRLLTLDGIKLKAFDLVVNQGGGKYFTEFLKTQDQLLYLTVSGTFSPSQCLPHMPKLKELAISNGEPLDGFKNFGDTLESLGIAGLRFYYDFDEPEPTYNIKKNQKLKELYLIDSTVEFTPHFVKTCCQNFENIRLLNIDGAIIDDSCFQYIFRLKKLQELKISRTDVTDNGITGFATKKSKAKKPRLSFEQEFEYDASISDLKELEVLNMDFCRHVTNASFKKSFELKKLKHFSAQGCNQISEQGVDALTKKCPKIESVNFSKCSGINDRGIAILTKHLQGLETLEIISCHNLTDLSLQQIMKNCKRLQTLDLTKSELSVKGRAKEMFEKVKSLRRIILGTERLYRCNFVN